MREKRDVVVIWNMLNEGENSFCSNIEHAE
jgi:hypothetical protein